MSTAVDFDVGSEMFRPPVNRLMKVLDRPFFHKKIRLSAAQIINAKDISKIQAELKSDILCVARMKTMVTVPEHGWQAKALLLKPEIKNEDKLTWSEKLRELSHAEKIKVIDYDLKLNYEDWNYHEIMDAILPADIVDDDVPSGFTIVGHVAHLNLREPYLPYKKLIGEVLLDKNPVVRSVINKIDDVGEQSEFRTFKYELLAGDPDMNVEIKTENCLFTFDFSKVYWNTRLNTEHRRMVALFKPGEAVCDVMAGVGPFAVPAGKKNVFVWANDLNPDSFSSLEEAIKRNKVTKFVKPFNQDGRTFIRTATQSLSRANHEFTTFTKPPNPPTSTSPLRSNSRTRSGSPFRTHLIKKTISQPKIFSHYIMNLPASASSFLPSFIGLYLDLEHLFPHTSLDPQMPMIHLYIFSTKSDDHAAEKIKICDEISRQLRADVRSEEKEVEIWPVRDVAPMKRMFCASFRLPAEVAFRKEEGI